MTLTDPRTPPLPDPVRVGVYEHYKGLLYETRGMAHDADHPGREVVVYGPLELDGAHEGYRTAVRTASTFEQDVCAGPGCPHYGDAYPPSPEAAETSRAAGLESCLAEGHVRPRFRYLGARFKQWMAAGR